MQFLVVQGHETAAHFLCNLYSPFYIILLHLLYYIMSITNSVQYVVYKSQSLPSGDIFAQLISRSIDQQCHPIVCLLVAPPHIRNKRHKGGQMSSLLF